MLRRIGFRTVIVWSSLLGALTLVAMVFVDAATPVWISFAVLLISGALRSIGFTAYTTLQFVDVPGEQTNAANSLSSTMRQVAIALGVAVASVLIHLGLAVSAGLGQPDAFGYRWAFIPAALIMLSPVIGGWLLPRDAGHAATRRAAPKPA